MTQSRSAIVERKTKETSVLVRLNLDGEGRSKIKTGIEFLDHMLEQLAFHGLLDLEIECEGDLHIDSHHSIEDIGIAIGQAFKEALGEKTGIRRYGHAYIPMDESLLRAVLDFSGRPEFVFNGQFGRYNLGNLDTQMIPHFFKSLAFNCGLTLHLSILDGSNDHHKCEGLFKAFARALSDAIALDPRRMGVSSTKGTL
ncbi:MAG: imidazoleglycerol-phosphate dehydratase HisB [SAR324 cluster bacterium]|jgi:imidazoleglycerol-phosphate dehydratase|nr:imidazoleglycerol-phosphate dehydratase [Deltaproteobacteria bacterium]MAD99941.1 imidazoleglycerol-phosphate dehydratase [Pseudomonadota bacterium]MDP6091212.1 imidazoleglycerol-phosphate dehydratase HisB [SAR324 cluster bacterium]MDP6464528.1 imidazoleglycerol-phosphate dehydratase HisB [SAR324 cluster bacterium]MDP7138669.1 imidazoleglycerol-phosphate dehydratase HisB [SAR324 cluster bacterium]|tara:strand:- start:12 stop:605 length:594 start_codon:yes stop_codon:yes gene_type:complete